MSNYKKYVDHIKRGNVLAYPTETVWGFGVDITSNLAIESLFELKGRSEKSAISILVRNKDMARGFAHVSEKVEKLMDIIWPGPVTLVLPCLETVSSLIHRGTNRVGLRCSSHPFIKDLMWDLDVPITTTSANRSGQPPAKMPEELSWVSGNVKVVEGDWSKIPGGQIGSTVVNVEEDRYKVLRSGDFNVEHLKRILNSLDFIQEV